MISKHADPRRATWLADQASDIFFELLPIDALNLTAMFGLPDAQQRQRAAAAAARMHKAASDAETAVDASIRALEASPGYERDIPMQQLRRNLAEIERDRRIPFLRGIAAILNADLNIVDAAQRTREYELAARLLGPLVESLEAQPQLQARLYEGLALAKLGRTDDARSRFAAVAGDAAAQPTEVFAARMGGVIGIATAKGIAAGLEALGSVEPRYVEPEALFFRVLIADRRFLMRRDAALGAGASERPRLLTEAFAAYTDLLKTQYPPGSVPRDALRSIVFSRLVTAAATPNLPLDQLPPIVAIAQADALSRDSATREQAIMTLEGVLAGAAAAPEDRAAALFVLGRALYEHDQFLLAAQRFAELAREHPADAQAERAIELAATLAEDEHRRVPGDAQATQLLRETLDLLLSRYPNLTSIDRWRYSAGALALEQQRFDDAAHLFAQVTPDAPLYADANFMAALTARDKAAAKAGSAPDRALHQQSLDATDRVQPIVQRALEAATDESRRSALRYDLGMLRVYRAEATLALGRAQEALGMLANVESEQDIDVAVIGEAMKVRINAYQTLRKPDEALSDLKRFVHNSPQQAGAVLQPMLASLRSDVHGLIDNDRAEEARELADRALLPAAKTLQEWLQTPAADDLEPAQAALLQQYAGDALRFSGQFDEALTMYDRLLREQPNNAELLLGKAECLFELGEEQRWSEAMTIYKRLGASGPAVGAGTYWLAQLRMLQILDKTNRNTQQILPRIERLRQSDATFGGERYRRGFEALRARHASG
jgi:tetratricopeptide (TPR) repeat protein